MEWDCFGVGRDKVWGEGRQRYMECRKTMLKLRSRIPEVVELAALAEFRGSSQVCDALGGAVDNRIWLWK